MAIVGLKKIKLALVDPITQQILSGEDGLSESGIYEVDEKDMGTKTANITNLQGSVVKVNGNNQIMDAYVNPSAPSVALDINNLAFDIVQKVTGFNPDGKGGYVFGGEQPHVALSIETQTLDRKNSIYFGFGNGTMAQASQNIATDTDTAQTREDDSISYSALGTKAFGGQPVKKYFSGDDGFEEEAMLAEIFGGYKADGSTTTSTTKATTTTTTQAQG